MPFDITDNRLGSMGLKTRYKIGFDGGKGVARLEMDSLNMPRTEVQGDRTLEEFTHCMKSCF